MERRSDFALREAHEDELDVEARARLRGGDAHEPAQVWFDAEPDQEAAQQRALFPAGVAPGASRFGACATCLVLGEF